MFHLFETFMYNEEHFNSNQHGFIRFFRDEMR